MKNLRILFAFAICWAIGSVVASKTIADGDPNSPPKEENGGGSEGSVKPPAGEGSAGGDGSGGSGGGSGSGDGEGGSGSGSGSGDGDGGAVATTTTSKASSFSQGMASLLLSLFIVRSFLY
ncbi:unnamed protein product [Hymenolepis diminuta]|uniref:Glycine-rich cell wall structural protein 1 n=1 Tax=Hymenolepis diminuta TaxID=6216 RepID=A0A0R3SNI4_HYMDI|nr:unnamed protein product [Hymenolepis diminuta]